MFVCVREEHAESEHAEYRTTEQPENAERRLQQAAHHRDRVRESRDCQSECERWHKHNLTVRTDLRLYRLSNQIVYTIN